MDGNDAGAEREVSLVDRAYEELLDRIRSGAAEIGTRLPSEMELASELKVSRPVLRQALARLRDEGLIVSRRGSGSYVGGDPGTPGAAPGGFGPLQSIDDIARWFEFRRVVEGETAALAARNRTAEDMRRLHALNARIEEVETFTMSRVEANFRLHEAIATIADNRFLLESMQMLRPHLYFVSRFVHGLGRVGRLGRQTAQRLEHELLLDCIGSGDDSGARDAMRAHISGSRHRIFHGD